MLGLKAGDRIAQANGIALRVPDDVTSAVIRPLIANQGVRVIGSRDGAPQEVWLANVACAG
jgi:type II secretory pathway component PulC